MTNPNLDIFDLKRLQLHQSKQELERTGRNIQQKVTSQDLSTFVPVDRDPVAAIQMTESKMIPELLPLRHQRMLASQFAFFRGTAELMERDLKEQHQSNIPIVISGDAHVNNFSLQVQEAIHNGIRAGRRIVTAQRVLQSSSDPFLASTRFGGRSYYVRQFRDMKESINVSKLDLDSFQLYCQVCALLLAMAHSQSPTSPMIRGYLKHQKVLDEGLTNWSLQYVKQVSMDYQAFKQAVQKDKQQR